MKARLFGIAWLLVAGCTIEQGGTDDFAVMTSGMSTGEAASTGGGDESSGASTSTSSAASTGSDTSGAVASSSTGGGSWGSGSSSGGWTDTGQDACGDEVVDPGEACDDGNDDEFDGCTAQCTVPACDDGEHNGNETDLDCGGPCQACEACDRCEDAADCQGAMTCGSEGRCVAQHQVSVDWVVHCPGQAQGFTVDDLPAGTYRATASLSAGTIWEPPHNPPTTGYFYEARCTGVTFEQMRTPQGVRYINVGTAFGNLVAEAEEFEHAGGDFTCWHTDDVCADNDGSVEFSLESVCEG